MNKLLVILGSTSTGKTDVALSLAKKFNGELISCDSRQVYMGLDLGTGKLPGGDLRFKNKNLRIKVEKGFWEIDGIKIWMYDVAAPKKQYTVYDYIKDATAAIEKIQNKGKLPIIVGGTGLYLKGLLYGFSNLGIPLNKKLRKELEKLSLEDLQKKLQEVSIKKWNLMNSSDRQNPRRLIRAVELGVAQPKKVKIQDSRFKNFDILKIGLTVSREALYERIDERVEERIKMGMIKEAEGLHKNGLSLKRMRRLGLEYGVLADLIEGKINQDQLVKTLQGKIHSYARRQMTWFKNPLVNPGPVSWFDILQKNYLNKVENLVAKWYYQANAAKD